MIILHQVLQEIGAQAAEVVGIIFVYDKGVAVVSIKTVPGGKPHEAPTILQNGNDIALRETIVRIEVGESEIPYHDRVALNWVGLSCCGIYRVNDAKEQDTTRSPQAPRRISENHVHALPTKSCDQDLSELLCNR
nr:hypothetical protein [Edaphobacter modestus]